MNAKFAAPLGRNHASKIAVVILGSAAPGTNNVVDGLLRYQSQQKGTTLVGFINGYDGVVSDNLLTITEESYAPYRNLGGSDYLGNSGEV